MRYIILDLEMNPVDGKYKEIRKKCKLEIIEIGAVMLDENMVEINSYKTYVKPRYSTEIFKKYENLTGITTNMVVGAPGFERAFQDFCKWCEKSGEEYRIYTWSENDYAQVRREMKIKNYIMTEKEQEMMKEWYDFQKEFMKKLGLHRAVGLEKALEYAGIEFKGRQHDALFDARNTAELFALAQNEEEFTEKLKYVVDALKPKELSNSIGDMVDFAALMEQIK